MSQVTQSESPSITKRWSPKDKFLIESLKLEIAEEQKENKYTVRLEELFLAGQKKDRIDTYEPDYYEEP